MPLQVLLVQSCIHSERQGKGELWGLFRVVPRRPGSLQFVIEMLENVFSEEKRGKSERSWAGKVCT